MREAFEGFAGTVLAIALIVGMFTLASLAGCRGPIAYPAVQPCPVLAELPTGEVVEVPREPSCPLPGPRPTRTLPASSEPAAIFYADETSLIDVERWAEEADLYIGCMNALPSGEP